ncbi:hypothetical protein BC830DRAFT_1120818 [Chytriomyces sp. MP71]|nr:hypothetical protein BC830DRAFT_1120818 [Chytriomyces sp. MP71]
MTKGTTTVGSTFVSAILETGLSNMTVSPANATFVNTTLVDSHASTVDDLLYHDMGIVNLVSIFQSFLAVITFLVFVFVLAFIPWVQRSFSSMLSPKNILLFGLAFFTGVSMAGYAAHTLKKDRTTASLIVVPIAFAELFYLSFSMERSRDVLRIQSSPMVYRVFQGIYYFTVVCLFIPAILILADYEHQFWYNVTTVVAAAGVVLLDCFFIHKTSRYIFKRTVEVSEVKGPDATGTVSVFQLPSVRVSILTSFLPVRSVITQLLRATNSPHHAAPSS